MARRPYGLICAISNACEILEPRWTLQILVELWSGSSRFNDLRRGLGNISTATLAKRLKDMEAAGLVERVEGTANGPAEYFRTEKAIRLEAMMKAMADWSLENIEAEQALEEADASTIIWAARRMVVVAELPRRRIVMRFHFRGDPVQRERFYWFVIEPGAASPELCWRDPGRDVDLYVETCAVSLGAILEGRSNIARERDRGRLFLSGDPGLARSMDRWLRVSSFATSDRIAQLS